jgi:hypothetical protein
VGISHVSKRLPFSKRCTSWQCFPQAHGVASQIEKIARQAPSGVTKVLPNKLYFDALWYILMLDCIFNQQLSEKNTDHIFTLPVLVSSAVLQYEMAETLET